MDQEKNIGWLTLLLTAVAGYCDTATFVAGDAIFSAHVTGNFIVFAAQLMGHGGPMAWVKLLTFPVFLMAVIFGGWLHDKRKVMLAEALLLLLAGGLAAGCPFVDPASHLLMYAVVMLVVFAMGLQNAFGRLFPKDTYGPTTMMTGNVTQFSLDVGQVLQRVKTAPLGPAFRKSMITIGGFLLGCVLGALAARCLGLMSVLFPGAALVICYLLGNQEKTV